MNVHTSRIIIPDEVSSTEFVSAEHSLKRALSQHPDTRLIRNIWYASPHLEAASKRLARMLSHHYPSGVPNKPLLHVALRTAAHAYEEALQVAIRQEHYEQAYLSALLDCSVTAIQFQAIATWADGRTATWQPGAIPLIDWVRKRRPDTVGFVEMNEPVADVERRATRLVLAVELVGGDHPDELLSITESAPYCR